MALELRGEIWHVRKMVGTVKINRSTKTSNRRVAEQLEAKWIAEVHNEVIVKGKMPINLHKMIDDFILTRSHTKAADNCRNRLQAFKEIPDQTLHKLTDKQTSDVVEGMYQTGYAPSTIKASVAYFNAMLNYAAFKGYSICKPIESIKGVKGKLRYLTIEEETKLLATIHPAQNYSGKNTYRDSMRQNNWDFICLLVDTGARHNEIAFMQWNQVDFEKGTVVIHRSKGGNDTVLKMTARMREILSRRKEAAKDNNVMIRPANEQNWLNGAIERAGLSCIPSKPTLHTLRHTFAQRFISNGGGLQALQHLLGHVNINSTMIYAHFERSDAATQAADIMDRMQANKPAPAGLKLVV